MAKDVYDPITYDALIDEFETIELAEQAFQRRRVPPYGGQQAHRELPADDRGNLQKPFGLLGKPIDARHHNIVDRIRHHLDGSKVLRLAGMKGQLLEKEGKARRLGDDLLGGQFDEPLDVKHRADDVDTVVPRQWLHRHLSGIGFVDPRWTVLRPVSRQHQNARVADIFCQEPEKLFRYLVDPMQILEHQDERPLETQFDADLAKDFEGFRLARFGWARAGAESASLTPNRCSSTRLS